MPFETYIEPKNDTNGAVTALSEGLHVLTRGGFSTVYGGEDTEQPIFVGSDAVSWREEELSPDVELSAMFDELTKKWIFETQFCSSVDRIVMHPAYQRIIGIGPKAVPLILRRMRKEPHLWFWALYSITGDDPVSEELLGDIDAMTNAWLEWGRKRDYC